MEKKNDSLDWDLKELLKVSLLTKEEELNLGRKIKELQESGDNPEKLDMYMNKMIRSNRRLVVWVAKKVAQKYEEYKGGINEDLLHEGNIGCWIAAKKYDYTRGNRFATIAVWEIEAKIRRYIENVMFEDKEERGNLRLNAPVKGKDGEEDAAIGDFTEDKKNAKPSDIADNIEREDTINNIVSVLPQKEKDVMALILRGQKVKAVSEVLKISREQVRIRQDNAISIIEKHPKEFEDFRKLISGR